MPCGDDGGSHLELVKTFRYRDHSQGPLCLENQEIFTLYCCGFQEFTRGNWLPHFPTFKYFHKTIFTYVCRKLSGEEC